MTAPFSYANPGERRNQSRPGWNDAPLTVEQLERIVPPVFNAPTEHRPSGGVGPGRIPDASLSPTPAPASFGSFPSREPAAFPHLRQGYGGQARGGGG